MRIGLVTGEYPPMQGGVGDFTHLLASALADLGHEVSVLTDRRGGRGTDPRIAVSAEVSGWNRACLRAVGRWVRERRLEVVNLQYQTAAYQMAPLIHLLPRLIGDAPFVTTFHDLRVPYLFPKAGPLRDWWVLRLARDSTAAIATNAEDAQRLAAAGDIRRIARIPIGSNIACRLPDGFEREAFRAAIGVEPGEILIGHFGLLNRSKGADVLLRAFAEADRPDRPLRLMIIGGGAGASDPTNAAFSAGLDALAAGLGISDRLIRTGFLEPEQVSAHLTCCDCCALPFLDGASMRRGSMLAALTHGCPVITTFPAVPIPEFVHRQNIYFVPAADASSLAAALREVAGDPVLRRTLAGGARALMAPLTWDSIATQTISLFSEIIAWPEAQ